MIKIYQNGQWKPLTGMKIYVNNNWKVLKDQDKIYYNKNWYTVG